MRFALIILLAFIIIFPAFSQENGDWYIGRPIRRVTFEGLNNVRLSDLEGVTQQYIGRNFTDNVFLELLGRLYALEYFEDINVNAARANPEGTEVILVFSVVERPVISRINFVGNNNIRRNDLLDLVITRVNDVATPARLRIDELAIRNRYLERGYPDVRVQSELIPGPNNTIIVAFNIIEGSRVVIDSFQFEGNEVFSARILRSQISSRTRGFIADGAYQEAQIIQDRLAIEQYYHDRGYVDAHIVDEVREIRVDDRGNNLLTITFLIYEGQPYIFGGITFQGNQIFSTDTLSSLVLSRHGELVNDARLQGDLMRIANLYFENGYIFNRIDPFPIRDTENRILSYQVTIVERGRAHIENIIIRGNVRTRDHVILREIPLEPGDIFSQSRVLDGLRNLYNLQYFSMVTPETPPGSTDSLMDLVLTVEEMPTTDVQFGLTFSGTTEPGSFPVSAMVRWNDRNFLGGGNALGAELTVSPDTQNVMLGFTHNWFLNRPLSMSYEISFRHSRLRSWINNSAPFFNGDEEYAHPDGFASWEDYISGRVPPEEYIMTYHQYHLSLGIGSGYRWLTPLGILQLGGGFRIGAILNSYNSNAYRPFDPVLRAGNNIWRPAISIWTNLSLDRRDIFYDPSSGLYASQRIGIYGIFPREHEYYIQTETRVQWFYTLFDLPVSDDWNFKAVLGLHTGLSFIFPQPWRGSNPVIQSSNMLFLDGMFIGRGWGYDEFNNRGLALWESWAEIRIPLVQGLLSWDFFFDMAGVKKTPSALFSSFFEPDDRGYFFMRFSYGGGIRFTIPQFPLRFSLARRFTISPNGRVQHHGGSGGLFGFDFIISIALSTF